METNEIISNIREYNKSLDVNKMNVFEKTLYKNIEERRYLSFDYISGAQYVEEDPKDFLFKNNHFSHLLKDQSYLLDAYIQAINEYSVNKGYLRISARSSKLSAHYTYLLNRIASFYIFVGGNLDIKKLVYGEYRNINFDFSPIIASYLLLNDSRVIQYCKDVILSENNTAVITRDVIQAIEMSHNEELQDLLLQLFLAARLQEGLRQSIAETCDEYQLSFFRKTIKVIIENNLIRYSSIQRAVLTWCGLGTDHIEIDDVKLLLNLIDKYVLNESTLKEAMNSSNPLELYIYLYSIGLKDVDQANQLALNYLKLEESHKVAAVISYLRLSKIFKSEEHLYLFDLYRDNDWIMSLFFNHISNNPSISKENADIYFKKIELYLRTFKNKKDIKTKGFEWLKLTLDRNTITKFLLQLLKINPTKANTTLFLPYVKYISYRKDYEYFMDKMILKTNVEDRKEFYIKNLITPLLQKKCKDGLMNLELNDNDLIKIEDKLKSKRSETRQLVSLILTNQSQDKLIKIHDRLLNDKDVYKQDAVKEIERKYPQLFNKVEEKIFYGLDEGFHMFKPVKLTEREYKSCLQVERKGLLVKKEEIVLKYNFKKSKEEIIKLLNDWSHFYYEHRNDSYRLNGSDHILEDCFYKDFSKEERLEQLPLSTLWKSYFEQHPIDQQTLFQIKILSLERNYCLPIDQIIKHKDIFSIQKVDIPYLNKIFQILNAFYKDDDGFIYSLELLELFLKTNTIMTYPSNFNQAISISDHPIVKYLVESLEYYWNEDNFKQSFELLYNFHIKYRDKLLSPLYLIKAYRYQYISKDELMTIFFNHERMLNEAYKEAYYHNHYIYQYRKPDLSLYELKPFNLEDMKLLRKVLDEIVEVFLNMEAHRLNEDTPVTQYLKDICVIRGIKYLPLILNAKGKDKFKRSSWGYDKNTVLTNLIRNTYYNENDDLNVLNSIDDKTLTDICMLAPQWIEVVDKHLKWNGFVSGCYYFIAHMKDYDVDSKKATIAKFTDLDPLDLRDGAIDIDWCKEVYEQLGEKHFLMLYDSAKYLCDNSFHTRARKYADGVLGKYDKEDILKQVKDKRNKDLLNTYCIIPIKNQDDLKDRYLYVQQFLKESKKFGNQRQASEKRACEIALINLARNSQYQNATRLTWAMETQIVQSQLQATVPHQIMEYKVYIEIDEYGRNNIVIINAKDKRQKSIPKKIKNVNEFIEIQNIHKQWNEQYKRSKKLLEDAMEERTEFYKEEIMSLLDNPIISPMIKVLLFIDEHHIDYIHKDNIHEFDKKIRIAHCYDLYKSHQWNIYQQDIFDKKIKQPFKQVFRELYVKLDEELEKHITQRYSGYQIQVKKAVSALKSRKWNVSYENGIERVCYNDDMIVNLYAEADWFSPSDIEAPAIDYITFRSRKTNEWINIKDIDDITYSEIMRDIDLACSISYVGGVDPITSISTIELRKSIVELTSKLMKLNNISIKDNFAFIEGKLGNYHVHLGSGIIHQESGSAINILPVHSQRRGKLYLPFIDDDPKCQEILSKIILLSEDYKIKDPSILKQIKV